MASNNYNLEWQDGDVFFSEYHYCNVTVREIEGNLSVKVDSLVFHDNNKSTTLADSFQLPLPPIETSIPTSTTTEKKTTTTTLAKTSTSTNIAFIPITISLIINGILRKKHVF